MFSTSLWEPPLGQDVYADVYVMLQGPLGDIGRRKLIRKGDENFTEGKVYL